MLSEEWQLMSPDRTLYEERRRNAECSASRAGLEKVLFWVSRCTRYLFFSQTQPPQQPQFDVYVYVCMYVCMYVRSRGYLPLYLLYTVSLSSPTSNLQL